MLLWETIQVQCRNGEPLRWPGDARCTAATQSGARCKGRARNESKHCVFHDPSFDLQARRQAARQRPNNGKRTRYHLDGIPSRLTTRRGITAALDRLYNDTRLGLISAEAGKVLFEMLERLLETHTTVRVQGPGARQDRSKAARLRRKLARMYITTEAKHRAAPALQTGRNETRQSAHADQAGRAVATDDPTRNLDPNRIKTPSLERIRTSAAKWSGDPSVPAAQTI